VKLRGEQSPAHSDTGGPNPARTKAEILAYLRQSFDRMDREIQATRWENLMDPVREPYAGGNRFEVLTSALWHISDHYGQLVTYAHMNGVVPPASR
jgi:hypothetical protein